MNDIRETLCMMGYEDAIVLENPSFDEAIVGVTDERVVYQYEKMVECLVKNEGMSEEEAVDFISYNTIRTLPYIENSPIVMYSIQE